VKAHYTRINKFDQNQRHIVNLIGFHILYFDVGRTVIDADELSTLEVQVLVSVGTVRPFQCCRAARVRPPSPCKLRAP
jgi:hypothetical protein